MPLVVFDTIIAIVVFLLCKKWEKKPKKSLWIIILSVMGLAYGLRYDTATDYLNYVLLFYRIRDGLNFALEVEPGYLLLNKAFVSVPYGFTVVLFICSLVSIYLLMDFMTRNKSLKWGLFFCFCFELIMMFNNQVRQGIAVAIFLYATRFIHDGKWWKFLVAIIIAMMFHMSAIIALVYYPLIRLTSRKPHPTAYLIIGVCSVIILLSGIMAPLLSGLFEINEHYARFQGTGYQEADSFESIGFVFIFNLLVYFYILINKGAFDKSNYVFYNMTFVILVLYCIFGTIPLMERLVRYLYAYEYVALAIVIGNRQYNKNRQVALTRAVMMMCICVYGLYCSYANNLGGVYKTVFSEDCQNHVFYERKGKDGLGSKDRSNFETYNLE